MNWMQGARRLGGRIAIGQVRLGFAFLGAGGMLKIVLVTLGFVSLGAEAMQLSRLITALITAVHRSDQPPSGVVTKLSVYSPADGMS